MRWRHLFLSPHFDDAVLSCGGTIALLRDLNREVVIVTVFAGDAPRGKQSAFGERHFHLWGVEKNALAVRQSEDEAVQRVLNVRAWYGQYPDAPFRQHPQEKRWLYTSDWALFRSPDPSEGDVPRRIAGEVSTLLDGRTRVYVPLGLGNHVDHVLLSVAGYILAHSGVDVVWYEDYPYAERDARVQKLKERGWWPALVPLTAAHVEAKIQAILCYQSQIPSLFGDERHLRRRVVDYMFTVSGRGYLAERFWYRRQPSLGGVNHAVRGMAL